MINGLLLDFYGTVVEDDDAIMDEIADRVAAGATVPVSGREVRAAWDGEYDAAAYAPRFRSLRDCAVLSLGAVLAEVGHPGDPDALCVALLSYGRTPPLRPGTREFLSSVTVPICVVSDVDREVIGAAMAYRGLSFTAVVTSEDVGAYKPDPAMFRRGLAALGLTPDEVVHVGDSIDADVRGAHAAGIRAAWINRWGRAVPEGAPVSYELTTLADLVPIVAGGG
jgi:2-haloacid dehalogenase